MGLKTGLIIGAAVGYYLGAKAGRERYEQIEHYLGPIRQSESAQELQRLIGDLVSQALDSATSAFRDATEPAPVIEFRRPG